MKGSIIQPLFFPWAGYFHLIIRSEIFIFLDDAQFKKTWCARNKILIEGREKFINMQLMKQPQVTNINERKFYDFNQDFDNLKNTIFNAYRHNKFFSNIEELFFEIDKDLISVNLSEFNIYFIKRISKLMNIKTIFHQSSNLNINKKLSKRVAEYMTYPDKNLCIGYINNYGVMFKKAKQRARAEAIRIRGLDCSQFRDAAFYDKQRRKLAIADAAKNALNENAESKKRIAESYNKNKSQGERCTYRKVGSYVRKTCY